MPYFKDKTGALHFLDDASFAHLLPEGSVEITDVEAEAIRIASMPEPVSEHVVDPVDKLRQFLAANPDVTAIL